MTNSISPALNTGSATPSPAASAREEQKLLAAATQFESILIASMLEKLQDTLSGCEQTPSDAAAGSLKSMAVQAVGQAIAKSSGFGLADFAVRHLGHMTSRVETVQTDIKALSDIADINGVRSKDDEL